MPRPVFVDSRSPMRSPATSLHLKWIEIDRQALRSNLKTALGLLGRAAEEHGSTARSLASSTARGPARLMAVVKADAYGHGAEAVSRLALANGASCLGVLTLAEAVALREKGISGPIVLLAPPIPEQAERIVREKIEPTIDSLELADALSRCVRGAPLPVHADLDYGLGRWGLPPKELDGFLPISTTFPERTPSRRRTSCATSTAAAKPPAAAVRVFSATRRTPQSCWISRIGRWTWSGWETSSTASIPPPRNCL